MFLSCRWTMCWFPWHCSLAPLLSVGIVGYVGSTKQTSQEFHLLDLSIWHVICSFRNIPEFLPRKYLCIASMLVQFL